MRLIDADALLEGIAELKQSPWFNNKYGYADRKEAVEIVEDLCIKNEPTVDAVEVVRCKDCVYCEPYAIDTGEDCMTGLWCGNNQKDITLQDFCSYGERRDED